MKKNIYLIIIGLIAGTTLLAGDCMSMKKSSHDNSMSEMHQKTGCEMKNHESKSAMHDQKHHNQFDHLNLSMEQQQKVDQWQMEYQKEQIEIDAEIRKLELDRESAIVADDFDDQKKINASIYELKKELSNHKIEFYEKVNKVLTEEQRENWRKRDNHNS